jgi:hypothetical protein
MDAMYRCALAWMLVACGRVGFDAQSTRDGANDAASIADAPADAAAFDYCAPVTAVPDPLVLGGVTSRVTNFMGMLTVVADVAVEALTPDLATSLAKTTSDTDGTWSLSIPTGGQPLDAVFRFSGGGVFTALVYPARPLAHDPGIVPNLFVDGSLTSVYGDASDDMTGSVSTFAWNTGSGTVVAVTQDCFGKPVGGVTLDIAPPPQALAFSNPSGDFQKAGTATEAPYASTTAINEPAGSATITASGAQAYTSAIAVGSGEAATFVYVQPASD